MNAVFPSGFESGRPIRLGPPCTGPTVMTPSKPVAGSAADKESVAVRQRTPITTRLIAGSQITLPSCGSCVYGDSFVFSPGSPATPRQDRSLWLKAATSSLVSLRFPLRRLQLFLQSHPSTPRDNRRDIFLAPILTTCYRRELWPYLAPVFPVRVSSEHEVCRHRPIPRQNA